MPPESPLPTPGLFASFTNYTSYISDVFHNRLAFFRVLFLGQCQNFYRHFVMRLLTLYDIHFILWRFYFDAHERIGGSKLFVIELRGLVLFMQYAWHHVGTPAVLTVNKAILSSLSKQDYRCYMFWAFLYCLESKFKSVFLL